MSHITINQKSPNWPLQLQTLKDQENLKTWPKQNNLSNVEISSFVSYSKVSKGSAHSEAYQYHSKIIKLVFANTRHYKLVKKSRECCQSLGITNASEHFQYKICFISCTWIFMPEPNGRPPIKNKVKYRRISLYTTKPMILNVELKKKNYSIPSKYQFLW